MGAIYRNPPLVEALCEFHFDPAARWDVTIYGDYYNRVRDIFPNKRQLPQVSMSVQQHEAGFAGEMREAGVRAQFIKADKSAIVQLAPNLLVVNRLPPYGSWRQFKEMILGRLRDYWEVAGQVALQQVELRYIDRFDFPAENFAVGEKFGHSDFLPDRLLNARAPFFLRLEMPQPDGDRLLFTFGSIEPVSAGQESILMDINYAIYNPSGLTDASLPGYLDIAHEEIEQAFESCLTEELRNQFQKEV